MDRSGTGVTAEPAVHHAERTYGRPMVRMVDAFDGLSPRRNVVLSCAARQLAGSPEEAKPQPTRNDKDEEQLAMLLTRRSVSPKRLGPPGPNQPQLELILRVALRAPDHGGLQPWRIIEFCSDTRGALAAIFEEEKRRRDPLASPTDLRQAREHATRAPLLLGFVVSPKQSSNVSLREQWLAAGAALCNLLNAAHQLGFGAIMLSGERCHDPTLLSQLGVLTEEFLAGFVSIGRIVQAPPERKLVLPGVVWSCWTPQTDAAARTDQTSA